MFYQLHHHHSHDLHMYAGIRKYIVGLVIKTSSDSQLLEKEKVYLGKLNMILVQVFRYKWYCIFINGFALACYYVAI